MGPRAVGAGEHGERGGTADCSRKEREEASPGQEERLHLSWMAPWSPRSTRCVTQPLDGCRVREETRPTERGGDQGPRVERPWGGADWADGQREQMVTTGVGGQTRSTTDGPGGPTGPRGTQTGSRTQDHLGQPGDSGDSGWPEEAETPPRGHGLGPKKRGRDGEARQSAGPCTPVGEELKAVGKGAAVFNDRPGRPGTSPWR